MATFNLPAIAGQLAPDLDLAGQRPTCKVVKVVGGGRPGARIYPRNCVVRNTVTTLQAGEEYDKPQKFDKEGKQKLKRIFKTDRRFGFSPKMIIGNANTIALKGLTYDTGNSTPMFVSDLRIIRVLLGLQWR